MRLLVDAQMRIGWACILALVVTAGCLGLSNEPERKAPNPIEAIDLGPCNEEQESWRLSAWRLGPKRQGFDPCASVPEQPGLSLRIEGINKGDHGAAKASPVPVDGDWLVPGDTGTLYRINSLGDVVWSAATHPSSYGIHGTPAIANQTAYIGAYDGALYAFDLATGEQLWRTSLGDWMGSSPLVYEGLVYVAVETHEPSGLIAIVDAATGEEVFRDERITNHPHSSIGLDPELGIFAVGANDGNLYAWNTTTREHLWTFETDGAIKGPIAIHDGAAFFGSWDDHVYRVDLVKGTEDWSYQTQANVMAGPAIDPGSGSLFVGSYDGYVYALDTDDGELHWRSPVGGAALSSPVLADGVVLVGSHGGHLYALNATDGEELWRYDGHSRVTSTPALQDGNVAFTTHAEERTGRFYVLRTIG